MKIEMCDEFLYRVNDVKLDITDEFNTCKENILRNNSDLKFYNGEWVKIKVNNFITHHVKPAQTLTEIAKDYSVDLNKIKADNNLVADKLFIGQILRIYK